MKRIRRLPTLAIAIVAAVFVASLTPTTPSVAHADPVFRAPNGGYYYGGGYAPGYAAAGYGYSPYGNGGYTYIAPCAYSYPSYRAYGFGNGFGTGATYNGVIDPGYVGPRYVVQPYRAAYNPYGYGGYSPYGVAIQRGYGY